MEKVLRWTTFAEQDRETDLQHWLRLTPQQRIDAVEGMRNNYLEILAAKNIYPTFQGVCRLVELPPR